jgi:hypothetical protein
MESLPDDLRTLHNVIQAAERETDISLLRRIVKATVDAAPSSAVIDLAKYVYQRGVEIERTRRN